MTHDDGIPVRRHPRLPSAVILVAAGVVFAAYFLGVRQGGGSAGGASIKGEISAGATLEALEHAIAGGKADAATWFTYGERLREAGRLADAAGAYRKVLETDPFHREARFHLASSLARAGDGEALYAFMNDLVLSDARLVLDLLERPECRRYLSEPRFAALHEEAKSQAMD